MSQELLDLLKVVGIVVIIQIISPILRSILNRKKDSAEAESIEADSAEKIKGAAADLVTAMEKRIEVLYARLKEVETENKAMKDKLSQLAHELIEQQFRLAKLTQENSDLRAEIAAVKAENRNLERQLASMRTENEALRSRVAELERGPK